MIRYCLFASIALAACTSNGSTNLTAAIDPGSDVPAADYNQTGGDLSIGVGETIHVILHGDLVGTQVKIFQCDPGATLTVDDPTVLTVATAPMETFVYNDYSGPVDTFAITGVKEGEAVLTGKCSGFDAALGIHVHP